MALNWLWDEKIGELIVESYRGDKQFEYPVQLYEGNAFLIMLYEYTDDEGNELYNMWNFFLNKTDAKKRLGLQENEDGKFRNIFEDDTYRTIKKIRLNKTKSRNFKDIIEVFSKGFRNITIEIFTSEGEV